MKNEVYIEPINILSYGHSDDTASVIFHIDGFRFGAEEVEEFFIDYPLHEDFYDAMKHYCTQYEKHMLKKFEEK